MNHMTMEAPELERLDAERRAEVPTRPVLRATAPFCDRCHRHEKQGPCGSRRSIPARAQGYRTT